MKVGAIIPAAGRVVRGSAQRFRNSFLNLGKPLLHHTLKVFEACEAIDFVVLVMPQAAVDEFGEEWLNGYEVVRKVVAGGERRQDSVFNGFQALEEGTDIVVVHDGVRPFTTAEMIVETVEAADKYAAAITAVPVSDTIKTGTDGFVERTVSRDGLWRVQTPQAFRYELFQKAFEKAAADSYYGTDEGALIEYLGERVKIVPGSELNIKITRNEDLILGENLLDRVK